MRVLMLVWTGVSTDTRVLREAATLVEHGWQVHIIGRAIPADFVPPPGITLSSVGQRPSSASRARRLSSVERLARWLLLPEHVRRRLAAWQAQALIEGAKLPADVVHAHDFTALPVGLKLAQRWGVPLVYDSHELWPGRPRSGRPTPLCRWRESRQESRWGSKAQVVLTVGQGIADELTRRYGWSDVRVIHNTFPCPAVPPQPPTAPTAALYAGRLAADRELEVISAASKHLDLPVVLIGPADDQYLRHFDPGQATIRSALPIDDVGDLLTQAGLALVTHSDRWLNHRLALPNKLFHAVRAGVPVVATDVGELARVVREHDLGELYPPGDAAGLVAAVQRAVSRYSELRESLRSAAFSLAWPADAQDLCRVYDSLTPSPRPVMASPTALRPSGSSDQIENHD